MLAYAVLRALLTLVVLLTASAPAPAEADLFSCRIIVTGTDDRQHPHAWERCLRDVIVKATGRPSLRDDGRVAAIAGDAPALREDFVYLDRMTDIPHHDEQGTRDRPYDLIVHFQPGAVTERLAQAGLHVWRNRPILQAVIAVQPQRAAGFRVTAEGDESERHRQALLAAADRFGIRVAIPTSQQQNAAGFDEMGRGQIRLSGALAWSDADFGWNAEWKLAAGDEHVAEWTVRGVSFDEAYRAGIGGAAERLSRR